MSFRFQAVSPFTEVILVQPRSFKDDRGWFSETYKASEFGIHGIPNVFVQDNHTFSRRRGTLRGLHFQEAPFEQGKLVRCSRGAVFDAFADIRPGSRTYAKTGFAELTGENQRILWVPPGFAHGIQTLVDETEVQYKVTKEYSTAHERSVRWDDPMLRIPWPITPPILSEKDRVAPGFDELRREARGT